VEEMNEALITNWNSVVSKDDETYILGDFLMRGSGEQARAILQRLNGKKYLIKGNHEKYLSSGNFDLSLFEWVKDYYVLDYKDARFILFHYPILEWQFYHRKSAHLYGHVHNNKSYLPESNHNFEVLGKRAINVGVDLHNFFPVSAEAVYERVFAEYIIKEANP
jgi:calcineurin-like phosphoesterase family protein